MSTPLWHPNATRRPITGRDGLTLTGPSRKIVLHTTETVGLPRYAWPPHLTFNPASGQLWQHVPFNRGAYALASTTSTCGWSVNWRGEMVAQVEIISYARDVPHKSDAWYAALRGLLEWMTSTLNVPWVFPFPFDGSRAYGTNGSVRQSCAAWAAVSGIVGHQHCPAPNTHWDPGRLDITRLEEGARMLAGKNRYDTARKIAVYAFTPPVDMVLLALGETWTPDALPAGTVGAPILLVRKDSIPVETREALAYLKPKTIEPVSGPAVIDDAVVAEARQKYATG